MGAGVLISWADMDVLRAFAFNPGDLWILAAMVIWAIYLLLLQRRPQELPPTVFGV